MISLNVTQGSQEWLDLRKNKIGASDAAPILNMSPWSTALVLWKRKLGLIPEQQINERMSEGTRLEPIAREIFSNQIGCEMLPAVFLNEKRSWQLASLDGWNEDKKVAVEIKCGGEKLYHLACNEEIPAYYMCQMQHQLSTLELNQMFYFVYFQEKTKLIVVERDDTFIMNMLEAENKFWDCLQNLETPELTDQDFEIRNDEEWINQSTKWKHYNQQRKHYEEMERNSRSALIGIAGNTNCKGNGISISKIVRKGMIDYPKLIQDNKIENLELYRKSAIESYRIAECK